MTKENKELIKRQLIGVVKTILFLFIIYMASLTLLTLMFYSDTPAGSRDYTPIHFTMIIIFAVAYYFGYLKKSSEDREINNNGNFDWKEDLSVFIKSEGKILFIIYGILAVINESALLIGIAPLSTILYVCFPLSAVVTIPILRTAIAYLVTVATIMVTTLIKHNKDHQYWSEGKSKS